MHSPTSPPGRSLTWHDRASRALGVDDPLPIDPDLSDADRAEAPGRHEPHHRAGLAGMAAVAAGGFFGATARYLLERAVPVSGSGFPLTTWLINTSGAFALGVVLTVLIERRRQTTATALLRAFACTGALGAWTTVSTLAGEADGLIRAGRPGLAVAYLAATFASGVVGTTTGIALGRQRAA